APPKGCRARVQVPGPLPEVGGPEVSVDVEQFARHRPGSRVVSDHVADDRMPALAEPEPELPAVQGAAIRSERDTRAGAGVDGRDRTRSRVDDGARQRDSRAAQTPATCPAHQSGGGGRDEDPPHTLQDDADAGFMTP